MSVRVKIDHDKVMKRVDKAKWKTILYQADTVLVTETDTTNTTLTD